MMRRTTGQLTEIKEYFISNDDGMIKILTVILDVYDE
jgi:hypothetical protein